MHKSQVAGCIILLATEGFKKKNTSDEPLKSSVLHTEETFSFQSPCCVKLAIDALKIMVSLTLAVTLSILKKLFLESLRLSSFCNISNLRIHQLQWLKPLIHLLLIFYRHNFSLCVWYWYHMIFLLPKAISNQLYYSNINLSQLVEPLIAQHSVKWEITPCQHFFLLIHLHYLLCVYVCVCSRVCVIITCCPWGWCFSEGCKEEHDSCESHKGSPPAQ